MTISYNGIVFDTVQELIAFKEWENGRAQKAKPVVVTQSHEPKIVSQAHDFVGKAKYATGAQLLVAANRLVDLHKDITVKNLCWILGVRKTFHAKQAVSTGVWQLAKDKKLFCLRTVGKHEKVYGFTATPVVPQKRVNQYGSGKLEVAVLFALKSLGKANLTGIATHVGLLGDKNFSSKIDAVLRRLMKKGLSARTGTRTLYQYYATQERPKEVVVPIVEKKRCEYRQFLSNVLKKYMNEPYRWPIEKARAMAAMQWETFGGKKTVRYDAFPELLFIRPEDHNILVTMVKNVVAMTGKMSWEQDGKMLNIESYAAWKDFVADFMQHSKEIAACCRAQNKFMTELVNDRVTIVYR